MTAEAINKYWYFQHRSGKTDKWYKIHQNGAGKPIAVRKSDVPLRAQAMKLRLRATPAGCSSVGKKYNRGNSKRGPYCSKKKASKRKTTRRARRKTTRRSKRRKRAVTKKNCKKAGRVYVGRKKTRSGKTKRAAYCRGKGKKKRRRTTKKRTKRSKRSKKRTKKRATKKRKMKPCKKGQRRRRSTKRCYKP